MFNALKRLDKKFLIIVGLIICLPILIIVFLAIIQGCGDKKISYEKYEEKMILALESYINRENKTPADEGEVVSVELSTLINKGYIKSTEKLLGDSSCEGTVSVRRNGSSIESTNGGFLNYIANLSCQNYSTTSFADKLKENLVTEGSGLYATNEGYIFKGNKVKNHIKFFGHNYRIMSIDNNGVLKLVKTDSEMTDRIWDNKFNSDINSSSGKNIYKDSVMLDVLASDYANTKKISTKAKHYVIAQDICIGKRNNNNYSIDSSLDCSEILENQVISLLNVSDYAKVSLDEDCLNLKSRSCNNYNYLYGVASSTWTLNASLDNTYEVFYLSGGMMQVQSANTYNSYNIVIYIDGNHPYTSGNGSSNNPYVIE